MSFKPQPGFSVFRIETGAGSQFTSLGPLAKGDVVRRIVVHVHLRGAGNWRWGGSLGVSKQGTGAGLRAGRSFISVSDSPANNGDDGFPHIGFPVDTELFFRFELFPGMMVTGASAWIQIHTMNIGAGDLSIFTSVEVTRFVEADGSVIGAP